jgi:hypothetical protein
MPGDDAQESLTLVLDRYPFGVQAVLDAVGDFSGNPLLQ